MGFYGGQKEVAPREFDPLYSGSGAADIRKGIFDALPGTMTAATGAARAAQDAAKSGAAAFQPVAQYGRRLLAGDYLNPSPIFDKSLATARNAGNVAAAGSAAGARAGLAGQQMDTRAQFGRSGQVFGTGNQLAQEGSRAALEANLNRAEAARTSGVTAAEMGARAANYDAERNRQMAAPGIIGQAASIPLNMLQAIPGLAYAGVDPAVSILRNLAGGGQVVNPNTYYKPGVGDYTLQGIGALAGGAGGGF